MSLLPTGWHNISDPEYFADPGMSASGIKQIDAGGAALYHALQQIDDRPSATMQFGTALHYAIFAPDLFILNVVERPEYSGTGMKQKYADWRSEQRDDAIILKPVDYDRVGRMADLCRAYAGPFTGGMCEVAGIHDNGTDRRRKIKVDYLTDDWVYDAKTAAFVDERKWMRQARDLKYEVQASWYEGTAWRIDEKPRGFRWLVIKNSDPITVRIYEASIDVINAGRDVYQRCLREMDEAERTGKYGRNVGIMQMGEVS